MTLSRTCFPEFQLPSDMATALEGRVAFALRLATAASNETLKFFRTSEFRVERKSDRSPVTLADKQAEQTIRTLLSQHYPEDSILGEEFGRIEGASDYEWIIDPIDGTKSFISGVPLYSTLVGMTCKGVPTIGIIAIPAMGEIAVAAKGMGAWYGDAATGLNLQRTFVSRQANLGDGLFVLSQVDNFSRRNAMSAYNKLESLSYVTRSWGDGYGYLLVATGRAELMVDPIVNPWDVAAVAPVIEEAGGKFTSWAGVSDIRATHCFASNGLVHDVALEFLKPFSVD